MNQEIWQMFHNQREDFNKLLSAEVKQNPLGLSSPSKEHALRFAETLILCPTIESAQISIRKDLEGGRSFLVVADKIRAAFEHKNPVSAVEIAKSGCPFYLISHVIIDFVGVG